MMNNYWTWSDDVYSKLISTYRRVYLTCRAIIRFLIWWGHFVLAALDYIIANYVNTWELSAWTKISPFFCRLVIGLLLSSWTFLLLMHFIFPEIYTNHKTLVVSIMCVHRFFIVAISSLRLKVCNAVMCCLVTMLFFSRWCGILVTQHLLMFWSGQCVHWYGPRWGWWWYVETSKEPKKQSLHTHRHT